MGDKTRGLYEKFTVIRNDGSSDLGGKHHGCEYFVLDLTHDPHAAAALMAYAESCAADYPLLAADLRSKVPPNAALKAELAAAQDDLAALRLFAANLDATHNATLKEMQITVRQELAAAQKDAARYRWLRDHDNDLWIAMIEAIKVGGEAMEAAIDKEMAKK